MGTVRASQAVVQTGRRADRGRGRPTAKLHFFLPCKRNPVTCDGSSAEFARVFSMQTQTAVRNTLELRHKRKRPAGKEVPEGPLLLPVRVRARAGARELYPTFAPS